MRRRVGAEADLGGLPHRLPAADRGVAGHDVLEQEIRHVEFPAHRGLVDLDHAARLALRTHVRRRRRHDLLVAVDVLEPEDEVVGGERRAVRPLHALAQEQRVGLAVVAELVALGHAGHDLAAVRAPEQQLVGRLDAVAVLAVAGPVKARRQVPPYLPISFSGCHTIGSAGNALLDRRQLAGLDQLGQHRRFGELLRPFRRIGDHRRALDLADQPGLRQAASVRFGDRAAQELHGGRAGGQARPARARRDNLAFDMGVSPQRSVAGQSTGARRLASAVQSMTVPPSTAIVCPVTKLLPSEISQATVPVRSAGSSVRWIDLPGTDHLQAAVQPFTEELRGALGHHRAWRHRVDPDVVAASSRASPRVKPITAAFDVV